MNKHTWSWTVPATTFTVALTLALLAGPKSSLLARDPADPTAALECAADVYNLRVNTRVGADAVAATSEINFRHGIEDTDTNNTVGYTCNIELKYKVSNNVNGTITESTRTVDVPLAAKPGHWQAKATGIVNKLDIPTSFKTDMKTVDKAVRKVKLAGSESLVGEDLTYRNPMQFKFTYRGWTGKMKGGQECENSLALTVPTTLNAAGVGTGSGEKFD